MGNGEWNEWSQHVLSQLKELRQEYREVRKEQKEILRLLTELRIDTSVQKFKTGLLCAAVGAMGGAIPSLVKQLVR